MAAQSLPFPWRSLLSHQHSPRWSSLSAKKKVYIKVIRRFKNCFYTPLTSCTNCEMEWGGDGRGEGREYSTANSHNETIVA